MASLAFASKFTSGKLLVFATAWIELESIMLSEISQAVKDKYHMILKQGAAKRRAPRRDL